LDKFQRWKLYKLEPWNNRTGTQEVWLALANKHYTLLRPVGGYLNEQVKKEWQQISIDITKETKHHVDLTGDGKSNSVCTDRSALKAMGIGRSTTPGKNRSNASIDNDLLKDELGIDVAAPSYERFSMYKCPTPGCGWVPKPNPNPPRLVYSRARTLAAQHWRQCRGEQWKQEFDRHAHLNDIRTKVRTAQMDKSKQRALDIYNAAPAWLKTRLHQLDYDNPFSSPDCPLKRLYKCQKCNQEVDASLLLKVLCQSKMKTRRSIRSPTYQKAIARLRMQFPPTNVDKTAVKPTEESKTKATTDRLVELQRLRTQVSPAAAKHGCKLDFQTPTHVTATPKTV
jgi:hypothetical protein